MPQRESSRKLAKSWEEPKDGSKEFIGVLHEKTTKLIAVRKDPKCWHLILDFIWNVVAIYSWNPTRGPLHDASCRAA